MTAAMMQAAVLGDDDPQPRDLMHDPWLTCAGEHLAAIAEEIFRQCEAARPYANRKPRQDATDRRRRVSANMIANIASLVLRHPECRALAVSARNDAITRYDRRDFPREVVVQTLMALEEQGFVLRHSGQRRQTRTTIAPSRKLRTTIQASVGNSEVGRSLDGETIILRASTGGRHGSKLLVDYHDTSETHQLRAEMARINNALNQTSITVDGIPCGPIHLTRRFQIGSSSASHTFDQHGRIYDGFWIPMRRIERHRIRINDEALGDADFTAMFLELAYLEAGLPLPEGDPYSGLPGLDFTTTTDPNLAADQRDAIKRGLNAFFFRKGRMERLPSEVKHLLGKDWTATRFAAAVRTRHAPIKHLFGTGIGIRLMFTESRILVRALLHLIDLGIPALPIHDGIMVPQSSQAQALDVMRKASLAIVGVELPVKAKQLPTPHAA